MDARAATVVAQRYELRERVGQGGCGVVYRAADRHTGQLVAVKMLSRATRQDPSFVERLVREQQALQALAGTHAVGVIDLCRADTGELCLVMEWLEGSDLEQRLTALEKLGTPFSVDELWRVIEPVLQTLEKAHELGIVHRDIKPANIFLLSDDGGVRLLDFGFSRLRSSATLTAADAVMGSPSYIAPEAWQHGSKAIEKQADLYAAGVIVFRALAGRVPFEGASLVETMQLVTSAPRPSLRELRPDLPQAMDEWVLHALAIAPERRFQHAGSFLEALGAALRGLELPAHTLPAMSRAPGSAPPPKTTPGERQNALSLAFGRAASLLKRVASSFSRAPAETNSEAPVPSSSAPAAAPAALAPPPALPRPPIRKKPALRPKVPAHSGIQNTRRAEPDSLIAQLLPPSLPPPAPAAGDAELPLEPLAPSRTIAVEGFPEPAPPLESPPLESPPLESPPLESPPLESPPLEVAPPLESPPLEAALPCEPLPLEPLPLEPLPLEPLPPKPGAEEVAPAKAPKARKPRTVAQSRRAASTKRSPRTGTGGSEGAEHQAEPGPAPPGRSGAKAPKAPKAAKAVKAVAKEKKAPRRALAAPSPVDSSSSDRKRSRRAKPAKAAVPTDEPKARKRTTKASQRPKRAAAKTSAKSARTKSGAA